MNAPFAKMTKSKSKISTGIKWNQNDIKGKSKSFHPWIICSHLTVFFRQIQTCTFFKQTQTKN
jgi:hypothetical protein